MSLYLQAATTIVASVIHSHYIGLDVTRKLSIPHSAHLPSALPAMAGTADLSRGSAIEEIGLDPASAHSEAVPGRISKIQQADNNQACSQQESLSATTSHHPRVFSLDNLQTGISNDADEQLVRDAST